MDSWLLSRDMKTKTKNEGQPRNNHKKQERSRKNDGKAMGNITPSMDHCLRNGQMGDTDL